MVTNPKQLSSIEQGLHHSSRLTLRKTREQDWPNYLSLLSDPTVTRLCFDPPEEPAIRERFEADLQPWAVESEQWLSFSIIETDTSSYVGTIGLKVLGGEAEVGFLLVPEFQGKGYATEALESIKDIAGRIGVAMLIARITEGNVGSVRVVEKCGFVLVGGFEGKIEILGVEYTDLKFYLELEV